MKMAFMILPVIAHGKQMNGVHRLTVEALTKLFGGATMYNVSGFWEEDSQVIPCVKIECAIPDNETSNVAFRHIAQIALQKMKVKSVMVQSSNGEVFFIEGDKHE